MKKLEKVEVTQEKKNENSNALFFEPGLFAEFVKLYIAANDVGDSELANKLKEKMLDFING